MTKFKSIVNKALHVISIVVVVIEILIVASIIASRFSGNVPQIFGYSLYVIASPSMTPELEVGDMIISRKYDGGELQVGQVVEYVGKSGDMAGKIITHKIVRITGEGDDRVIVTKGTANLNEDPPIAPADILSVMTCKTFLLDKIYGVITSTPGFICLIFLPMAAMIITEIVKLMIEVKGEKDGDSEEKNK